MAAADGLPVFPRLKIDYKGVQLGELDVQGLIARKPELVLIDELAHTNVPGALRPKRFMDVEALLNAGINVISTLNIQHLESLNDDVARLTKVRVRERVPDRIVLEANEVVIVDISPEALRERLKEGKIYASDKVDQALTSWLAQVTGPPFDLVFLDPPFDTGLTTAALAQLRARQVLAPGGWVYLEQPAELPAPENWVVHRSGRAGAVGYYLLHEAQRPVSGHV